MASLADVSKLRQASVLLDEREDEEPTKGCFLFVDTRSLLSSGKRRAWILPYQSCCPKRQRGNYPDLLVKLG